MTDGLFIVGWYGFYMMVIPMLFIGTVALVLHMTKRKAKAYQLLGCKCKICEYSSCMDAMDLHHINKGDKSFPLSQNWGLSWDKVKAELDKCVLLCCRCHREVHAGHTNLNYFLGGSGEIGETPST